MPQTPELIVIILIVVIIISTSRIPDLGDALGKAVKNFKSASSKNEIDVTPQKPAGKP